MKNKIYFGHPIDTYNTAKECILIECIEKYFPEYDIENPNQFHHQQNYYKYKLEKGNGMLYYFSEVLPKMMAGVFLPFKDDMFGAGVYGEANFLYQQNKPIFEINRKGIIKTLILDSKRSLSIEETRKRVYRR
jgi:hypothetical protein